MMESIRYRKPEEIERRSMQIIEERLDGYEWPAPEAAVVRRCVHTSADFDYAENLVFSPGAVEAGMDAIRRGASIVTDTKMAEAGINRSRLEGYGGRVCRFMPDEDVAREARRREVTRAAVSMEKASRLEGPLIVAVGNAPTALIRLYELIQERRMRADLVIGVPVGFVNVVESKELILTLNVPYIVARGNKGGSNIAAAVCNAILYQMEPPWRG